MPFLLQPAKDTDYYVESGEHEREKRAIATIALQYIQSIPEYLYGFRNYNPATYLTMLPMYHGHYQ